MHTIYVAGPVLRNDLVQSTPTKLGQLYAHLATVAGRAHVDVRLPTFDSKLDKLEATFFAQEIWSRIRAANSLLALIDAPGAHVGSNLSVAGEAHWAAEAGKPVALVAKDPERVPRLLRAVSPFEVFSLYGLEFEEVFRALREASPAAERS
jgi:hypothetical protein